MVLNTTELRYVATHKVTYRAKLEKIRDDYLSQSLQNGSKKQRSKFALLSKSDKREWRESLMRIQDAVARNSRQLVRAMDGKKVRGKSFAKIARANERSLKALFREEGLGAELQSGTGLLVGTATGAAVAMTATAMSLSKQVGGIGGKVSATIDELRSTATRIGNDVDGLIGDVRLTTGSVRQTSDVLSHSLNGANSLLDDLRATFEGFVSQLSSVGTILKRVATALFVWWVCERYNAPLIVTTMLSLLSTVAPEIVEKLKSLITQPQLQDGMDDCSSIITMLLTCWMPKIKDSTVVASEFMKRVSNFPRAKDGIAKFMEDALQLFEKLINFIIRPATEDKRVSLITRNNLFVKWAEKTNEYRKFLAANAEINITKILEIRDHYLFGFGLYEHLHSRELQDKWKYLSGQLGMALEPHQGAITASHNLRAMPVWAQFGGGSGVGKTSLIKSAASIVLWLSGEVEPKEALANIWQKGTTEYWNGYVGQKCLVIDDAFQVKPKQGDPDSEAMQAIRAVGNFACPLNFADVHSKGRYYLNTPLIVSTTNAVNVSAEWEGFITSPAALARRIQYGYWVTVSDEWKTEHGRLDYDKFQHTVNVNVSALLSKMQRGEVITTDDVVDVIPWQAWTIFPHGFDNSAITQYPYEPGMRQVVLDMASELAKRRKTHEQELKTFDDWTTIMANAKFEPRLQNGPESYELFEFSGNSVGDDSVNFFDRERMAAFSQRYTVFSDMKDDCDDEVDPMTFVPATTRLQRFQELCVQYTRSMKEWVSEWAGKNGIVRATLAAAGTMAVIAIGFKLIKAAMSGVSMMFESLLKLLGLKPAVVKKQSGEGKVVSTPKPGKFRLPDVADATFRNGASLQVGVPPQEGAYDKVYANTYKVHLVDDDSDEEQVLGHFICVGTNVFVFNKHFLQTLGAAHNSCKMRFYHATSSFKLDISVRHFFEMLIIAHKTHDVAAVRMDLAALKSSKNIVNLFLKESELKSLLRSTNVPCRLDLCNVKVSKKGVERAKCTHYTSSVEYVDELECDRETTLIGLVKYKLATKGGDCGALLSVVENRHYGGRCVIGFHSAGMAKVFTREGFATLLTQEVVKDLWYELRAYEDKFDTFLDREDAPTVSDAKVKPGEPEEIAKLQDACLVGGSMIYLGKLETPVNIACVSALMPSPVQEEALMGPTPSLPAHLRPVTVGDVMKYPMVEGTKAYQSEAIFDSTESLKPIVDIAFSRHAEKTVGAWRGILTVEESVVPPESLKLKRINPNTSPGYKFKGCVSAENPGKRYFFGHGDDWPTTFARRPEFLNLKAKVESIISDAEKGIRQTHLCVDFLKDELRPLHKVENVMTRVISGTELDYCMAVRMYFGAFLAATFDSRIVNGMAPGINHYTEWGELASNLLAKGRTKVFDGDFKRFDASEQPWITNALLKYIEDWYRKSPAWKPEHERVRQVLWLDLIHSRHVVGLGSQLNHVVQWNKSLPSGHPLTTLVNSMYSLLTIVACYYLSTGRLDFWDQCFCNTFGDDNITAISDEVAEEFNQVSVAENMKVFGLTYTSGKKDGSLEKYTTIDNVTFLKRTFVRDEDEDALITRKGGFALNLGTVNLAWVGPLDPDSFLYEPYWFKNKRDMWGDVARRIEHALCEMSLHDEAFWNKHASVYIDYARENNLSLPFQTRAQARHHVKTRFDVWF